MNEDVPLAADFDADGRGDITVFRPSNGTWYTIYSSLGYATNQFTLRAWGVPEDKPSAEDLDGDGKADIGVWRPSNATWYTLYSTMGYSTGSFGLVPWGLPGDIPIIR